MLVAESQLTGMERGRTPGGSAAATSAAATSAASDSGC
jgi:hypothetical protein